MMQESKTFERYLFGRIYYYKFIPCYGIFNSFQKDVLQLCGEPNRNESARFLQDVGLQKCQLENFNSAQFEFYSEMDWNAVFAHVASQRETSMKYVEQIVRQDK